MLSEIAYELQNNVIPSKFVQQYEILHAVTAIKDLSKFSFKNSI